jgi:hypothetical protein
MSEHPVDNMLKRNAYFQGATLCYMSLNILLIVIFCLDFKLVNFVIGFGILFIFIIRGDFFISEIRKSTLFKKNILKCLIVDSMIMLIGSQIISVFYFFKVFTLIWFCVLVSNHEKKLDSELS